MDLVDKNVGYGFLLRQFGQPLLNVGTIGHIVQFQGLVVHIHIVKQIFGPEAVRAIAFTEDLDRGGQNDHSKISGPANLTVTLFSKMVFLINSLTIDMVKRN